MAAFESFAKLLGHDQVLSVGDADLVIQEVAERKDLETCWSSVCPRYCESLSRRLPSRMLDLLEEVHPPGVQGQSLSRKVVGVGLDVPQDLGHDLFVHLGLFGPVLHKLGRRDD